MCLLLPVVFLRLYFSSAFVFRLDKYSINTTLWIGCFFNICLPDGFLRGKSPPIKFTISVFTLKKGKKFYFNGLLLHKIQNTWDGFIYSLIFIIWFFFLSFAEELGFQANNRVIATDELCE